MYKRPSQARPSATTKWKKQQRQKKHLYLVLDDWEKGYTIHKIDADDGIGKPVLSLSDPPVQRLVSPAPCVRMIFTSMGSTHILAASCRHPATLAYDTETAALAAGPPLPDALLGAAAVFVIPTADTLCAFAHHFQSRPQSVEVMSSSSAKDHQSFAIPTQDWSWRSSVAPPPLRVDERICSYAAHPDGRTVFVTARTSTSSPPTRTFSFDTGDGEWRWHGDWALPFKGHGYFDGDLDAWVGLHPDGYVGTCQVVSRRSNDNAMAGAMAMQQQLDWKMAKDKLWSEAEQAAGVLHGPTLTAMGDARFCIVDCVKAAKESGGRVLRITTFRLRYSRKEELEMFDRDTRSCPVSKHLTDFSPLAFWM